MICLLKISFKTNLHHINDQNLLAYSMRKVVYICQTKMNAHHLV